MHRKRILALAIAGVLAIACATGVVAQNADNAGKTMEQRSEQARTALKDAWLDGRLEATLLFNEHLNSFDIDTGVENGVVRLEGTVESDIERDLAGEIAKSIDGVTRVENDLTVDAPTARTARDSDASREARGFKQAVVDATLTARVKSQLLTNSNTSGLAVDVDSRNGSVTLTGTVDSDEEKELIARIAGNTSGVKSVDDRLMVEPQEEAE